MPSKKLYVLRHGKSDWNSKFTMDHQRPLSDRGVEGAKLMGKHLSKIKQPPELILSSTATRAFDTAKLANEEGEWGSTLLTSRHLYLTSVDEMIEQIKLIDDTVERLMIVSHEPSCSELISEVCMGAYVKFPTAALARIDFRVDKWSAVKANKGQLAWLLTPKSLK